MRAALALGLVLLSGCNKRRPDDVPVEVSVIGGTARPGDPSRGPLDLPARVLMGATAQGLVHFDALGQIEPGLAERWIVIDDGRSYIFRLRDARWPNGRQVTADQVVRVLKRAAADNSRNTLAPFLAVIDEIVAMTPRVIEVRLKRPRPDLLKLFAQPEMAVFDPRSLAGSGPFQAKRGPGAVLELRPAPDPLLEADPDAPKPGPESNIRLRGERAALAIARFMARKSDLVLGGSFADWPLLKTAGVVPANLRTDPAQGLFGLAIVRRQGFLADPAHRAALSAAIDRASIVADFADGWAASSTLLPDKLDSAQGPALPPWTVQPIDQRQGVARITVQAWQASHADPLRLRIALPSGPGATQLWSHLARTFAAIGIASQRVPMDAEADLRLVDEVAPYDSGRWYLVTACQLCSDDTRTLIDAARDAPDLYERAHRIAEADQALTAETAFIPIAQPLRWSIVSLRLPGWQGNPRAWHPLNHLRDTPH
jgi:peptide/nickel transport system substrate-binding protein